MLVGPPHRPHLPEAPHEDSGLAGIYAYLRRLDRDLGTTLSAMVGNTVGMLGVRGLSSSGVGSRNFVTRLAIGNQTSMAWVFSAAEADTSYLLFYSPSASTGMVLTNQSAQTTQILLTFNPAVPSGLYLDLLLLR